MATSFKKTSIVAPRVSKEKLTPDGIHWKNLETPVIVKEYGAITHVSFSPVKPHNFAVTNSMRVQLYSGDTGQLSGTISRFKDVAYSGSYRRDGKLLVAGTEDKFIKLFNPTTRSLLRTFKGHNGAVHMTKFLGDQFRLVSGSDDKTVRVWDIPTEKEVHIYQEHEDYIRCGAPSLSSQDIFLSGGYDHQVKLWDARTPASVMSVQHGHPVESVLMFPNGGIFLSAGGNVIKVWDALAGGQLLATLTNHHKTVTSLCFCNNYERFMSASLDKHVKVYDVATYQVVHTMTYSAPILSHAVSPDDQILAVGMTDKMLSIQRRKTEPEEKQEERRQGKSGRGRRYRHGNDLARAFVPSKTDNIVAARKRELLAPYDKHLKSFNHSSALDAAMQIRRKSPEVTVSVLQELIRRGHIRAALAGRDDPSLCIILNFIQQNLSKPQFMGTLIDVFNLILDMYGMPELVSSGPVESMLVKIRELVNLEVKLMSNVQEIMGSLDMLVNAAENNLNSLPSDLANNPDSGMKSEKIELMDSTESRDEAPKSLLSSIGSLQVAENGPVS